MPEFKNIHDGASVKAITMHQAGKKRLHLAGVGADKKAITVTSNKGSTLTATLGSLFNGPQGIWTVDLAALAVGTAQLEAKSPKGSATLAVTVEPKQTLPLPDSAPGMLVRLFLAEVRSPDYASYSAADAKKSMQWMRLVLENRLAHKDPGIFAAKGAKTLIDIVKAKNQFKGFEGYPAIDTETSGRIDGAIALVNNDADKRQDKYKAYVDLAVEVAKGSVPVDPCPTRLYGWRTAGSSAPGGSFVAFGSPVVGNQFYTLK